MQHQTMPVCPGHQDWLRLVEAGLGRLDVSFDQLVDKRMFQ